MPIDAAFARVSELDSLISRLNAGGQAPARSSASASFESVLANQAAAGLDGGDPDEYARNAAALAQRYGPSVLVLDVENGGKGYPGSPGWNWSERMMSAYRALAAGQAPGAYHGDFAEFSVEDLSPSDFQTMGLAPAPAQIPAAAAPVAVQA